MGRGIINRAFQWFQVCLMFYLLKVIIYLQYEAEDVETSETRTVRPRLRPSSAKASGSESMLLMRKL